MNVIEGRKYKQKNTGTPVLVQVVAKRMTDGEPVVCFAENNEQGHNESWVCSLAEFKRYYERVS